MMCTKRNSGGELTGLLGPCADELLRAEVLRDDSVQAWFRDGDRISLSSCGAAYGVWGGRNQILRLTQFAVSEHRVRVAALVRLRNYFAERPFLCKSLIDSSSLKVFPLPVCQVSWPKTLSHASEYLEVCEDGATQLSSIGGLATVKLAAHGQTFLASYFVPLPEGEKGECYHMWTSELHSVLNVPECWCLPVALLQQCFIQKHSSAGRLQCSLQTNLAVLSSSLPLPLPLSCPRAHLHSTSIQQQGQVKALLSEGVLYSIFTQCSQPVVEVLSISHMLLRSSDERGRFFSCWTAQEGDGVIEHLYSTDFPPPHSSLISGCSVARMMGCAQRLLASNCDSGSPTPCWRNSGSPAPCWRNSGSPTPCWRNSGSPAPCWRNSGSLAPCWRNSGSPTPCWRNSDSPAPCWRNSGSPTPCWRNSGSPTPCWRNSDSPAPSWMEPAAPSPIKHHTLLPTQQTMADLQQQVQKVLQSTSRTVREIEQVLDKPA